MTMNMLGTFLVSIALTLANVDAATPAYPSCSSLNLLAVPIDYQRVIDNSPFKIYRSILPFYNCSKAAYIKAFGQYTGTGVLIKGNSSFLYWLNQLNGTTWDVVQCANGDHEVSKIIFNTFDSERASFCYVVCDDDGVGYKDLACLGKNSQDEADIQKFLDTSLKGVPGIRNTQKGCTEQPYCNLSTK